MSEKNLVVTLIEKLRAILLMEADSNASYKEIFRNCMLDVVRVHGFVPEVYPWISPNCFAMIYFEMWMTPRL